MSYYDRFRFMVEDNKGNILTRDLIVMEPVVIRYLSGPCVISFKIHYNEPSVQKSDGTGPIEFKPWGTWIHAVKEDTNGNEIIWASAIVKPSEIDPQSGILSLEAEGFSNYPKDLPWLDNFNPLAVDPFEIVERIWDHVQSYEDGNLGVTVYPTSSGTQMLPGWGFSNEEFVHNFFAIFIRESDMLDCGDYINKLARDIPFDFWEESTWEDESKAAIVKKIHLSYPSGGVDQTDLIFRVNENVISAKQKGDAELSWASDIIIRGWFPQKVYSSQLKNADPDRYRRVVKEEDLHIDSTERAAAWAHRKLTRLQTPHHYESITIDPYHSNAPFSSFDVGDTIRVQGPMAWHGNIDQLHKVMAIAWDEAKGSMEVKLKAEGQFNYDPIEFIQ